MLSRVMVLALLVLALAITGVCVSIVAHWHRGENGAWSELRAERKELLLNRQRLQIELSVWSQPVRIEEVAREQMGLTDSDQQNLVMLNRSGSPKSSSEKE